MLNLKKNIENIQAKGIAVLERQFVNSTMYKHTD